MGMQDVNLRRPNPVMSETIIVLSPAKNGMNLRIGPLITNSESVIIDMAWKTIAVFFQRIIL